MSIFSSLFKKNTNYNPNDQTSNRYLPTASGTGYQGLMSSAGFGQSKTPTATPKYGSSLVGGGVALGADSSASNAFASKPQQSPYTATTAPFNGANINQQGTQGLDFDKVMAVLSDIESGGNWKANSDAKSGTHSSSSALGKFQIVPKWWFGSIGLNPNSYADRELFLNSQDLQTKALRNVVADYGKKAGGDPTKFAQMYFGGTNPNPNATDQFGRLTVSDYGRTFADKYAAATGGSTGAAGLADAAANAGLSSDEYMKLVAAQNAPGSKDYTDILTSLGISGIEADITKAAPDLEALYLDAYNKSSLPTIKNQVAELDKKIADRRTQLNANLAEHNGNPFISGATKNARVAQEKSLAAADLQNLVDQRAGYIDTYDREVTQIENTLARVNNNFTTNREIKVDQLNYLLNKAEKMIALKENDATKEAYRYVPDYLNKKTKADADKVEKNLQNEIKKELSKNGSGALGQTMLDLQQRDPSTIPFLQAIQFANQGASSKDKASLNLSLVTAALSTGDTKGARQAIVNAVTESLTGETKTTTEKRAQAAGLLNDIKVKLDAYKAAGGNTNLLTGNLQQVQQKLGAAGNPAAAELNTEITALLQNWRSAVTGAAWGTQEDAEYKRIMPSLTDTNKLNIAKIEALQKAMDAQNRAVIASKIGDGNYESIFKSSASGQVNPATATLDALLGSAKPITAGQQVTKTYRSIMDALFN